VLAIREDGRIMWRVPLATGFATSGATALGRAAGGAGCLVVATARPLGARDPQPGRIELLDGPTGRTLVTREYPSGLGRPVSRPGAIPRLFVGSRDGVLRVFDVRLTLLNERRIGAPVDVGECADLDRDGVLEVVAATSRAALILDDRLRTLAALTFPAPATDVPEVRVASAGLGNSRLCVSGSPAVVADVIVIPPFADPLRAGAVAALALVTGLWVRSRGRHRSPGALPAGADAREFLLDYHQIRHETFGRERPFARVRLWAQAQVAGHPLPGEVLESARDEYHRLGAPTLQRFARRAADLVVDQAQVGRIERLSREIEVALQTACSAPSVRVQAVVEGALSTMTALSGECLGAYREVALRDVCRPDHEAQEAVLAKRAILDRHGVALHLHVDPSGKQPVLFDTSELRAVVGELIENSARALSQTSGGEVRLTVAGKPGDARWIVLRIEDNGPGIAPGRRESVFAPGGSSHPEGGFGLHRAREIAHRWLADLSLEEPASGRGAVVRLSLRSLLPHDAVAAGDVATHPPVGGDA
jgi:signal transduction histidine kinase